MRRQDERRRGSLAPSSSSAIEALTAPLGHGGDDGRGGGDASLLEGVGKEVRSDEAEGGLDYCVVGGVSTRRRFFAFVRLLSGAPQDPPTTLLLVIFVSLFSLCHSPNTFRTPAACTRSCSLLCMCSLVNRRFRREQPTHRLCLVDLFVWLFLNGNER